MRIKADIMTPAKTSVYQFTLHCYLKTLSSPYRSVEIRHLESWSQRVETMSSFWERSDSKYTAAEAVPRSPASRWRFFIEAAEASWEP